MLDPQAADEQRDKVASDTKERLESQGTVTHEATWGLRKMAYEIEQRAEADYRFYRFTGEKALLDDLDHNLKITDGVLRFRVFKVDADAPIMVPPDTETIMRRDEDDERPRGRGGRDRGDRGDRGPRRPRDDDAPREDAGGDAPAPAAAPAAAPAVAAPAPAAEAPAPAEAPAAPAEAPAAPAEAPAAAPEPTPGE